MGGIVREGLNRKGIIRMNIKNLKGAALGALAILMGGTSLGAAASRESTIPTARGEPGLPRNSSASSKAASHVEVEAEFNPFDLSPTKHQQALAAGKEEMSPLPVAPPVHKDGAHPAVTPVEATRATPPVRGETPAPINNVVVPPVAPAVVAIPAARPPRVPFLPPPRSPYQPPPRGIIQP